MKGLRAAASLLTRVRVRAAVESPADMARSVPWFPVVGGLLGLALAGAYAATRMVLPPFAAAALAVGTGVLLTGAFHEDGLADTADALGGGTREESLRIMKDPAHGTYGVLAIAMSVLLRSAGLASLGGWTALAILPAAHALSRAAAAGLLAWMPAATSEGLGASYAGAVTRAAVLRGAGIGFVIALASLGAWVVPALPLTVLGAALTGWLGMRRLGGVTGDLLGAAQQVGETAVLLMGSAVVLNGWPGMPWWR